MASQIQSAAGHLQEVTEVMMFVTRSWEVAICPVRVSKVEKMSASLSDQVNVESWSLSAEALAKLCKVTDSCKTESPTAVRSRGKAWSLATTSGTKRVWLREPKVWRALFSFAVLRVMSDWSFDSLAGSDRLKAEIFSQ